VWSGYRSLGWHFEYSFWRSEVIRNEIIIHDFVVMPNHLHVIVQINCDSVGAKGPSPVHDSQISGFKAAVTTQCRQSGHPEFAWHRGYHERILRKVDELFQVRQYIRANPMEWAMDAENYAFVGAQRAVPPTFHLCTGAPVARPNMVN